MVFCMRRDISQRESFLEEASVALDTVLKNVKVMRKVSDTKIKDAAIANTACII